MLPVTRALLIANLICYALEWLFPNVMIGLFALWQPGGSAFDPPFHPWQLVTYGFLHDPNGIAHILFNMFALYMFGSPIESLLGRKRFAIYYFVAVLGAAVAQIVVNRVQGDGGGPMMGASGGVFGLLLAYGLAFPHNRLMLMFPPIPMPAWLFVTLYGILELVLGVTRSADGVAHFAHLGGAAAGFVLIMYWRMRSIKGP